MERWQKPESDNSRGATGNHPARSSLDYNTPLRSVRGDATSAPSPFYKLSAELSRESLRIPGAVPFMWEQSPGRRKFTAASPPSVISPRSIIMKPQAGSILPESATTFAVDLAKPNLATLFRQPSLEGVAGDIPAAADSWPHAPLSSAIPQISPPPAADHPRSSSARYSMQRNMPPGTSFNNAALQTYSGEDDDAVSEEATSDALTATAGEGLSMDCNSLPLSGTMRPASTPSEARDFIMHRFLPAAHTIACESPQMPSRRFLPPMGVAAASYSPSTPPRCNGSFRDYAAASRPSPLRYASASSTPASNARHVQYDTRGQLHAGSCHGKEEEEEEEEEEENVEEEPPFTPKACGIFPFRITLTFQNRHNSTRESSRRSPSSKHQHDKQQHQKKGNIKSKNCAGSPMRIMDILHDDHSSSHDDESPVHGVWSKQSEAERERTKIAVLEQAGSMHTSYNRPLKPRPFDSYYRESPNLHQLLTAQQAASEIYNEEASEYGSYQDAPSRFQSPSPAACHPNARPLRAYNMQPPLANGIEQTFAALQDDHKSAAIIRTTEDQLLNSSFYYYNMHTSINKPHYQPQLASPSAYHAPLSSHVGASHQICAYPDNISNDSSSKGSYQDIKALEEANYNDKTTNIAEQWDAQKTHIINNALYEHEAQETNMIANSNGPSMFTTIGEHVVTNSPNCYVDQHGGQLGDHIHVQSNGDHYMRNLYHYVSNGSHQGDHYASNNHHYATKYDPHYVDNHVSKYVSNGDIVQGKGNSPFPSNCLLSPPLPKSPTHSWLDRTMPLVASTNKSLGTSSRLSHMHKATTPGDEYAAAVSMNKTNKQDSAAEASKWEALVKGSHLQPGHLRFSEELLHQSQSIMKVGAS